jgi:hypothetical protein
VPVEPAIVAREKEPARGRRARCVTQEVWGVAHDEDEGLSTSMQFAYRATSSRELDAGSSTLPTNQQRPRQLRGRSSPLG